VYNNNTGWTTYDLTASGGATNLALAIPSVGAYLSGNPTVAHTWCPEGTASNYKSMVFYPEGDSVPTRTDVLAATTDGRHILGATTSGGAIQLSDIGVTIPSTNIPSGLTQVQVPLACPQSGASLQRLQLTHTLNQVGVNGVNATAINQIVTSPVSSLAFLTYQGTTPGAKLPYYVPVSNGGAGAVNYVTLTGGNAVTAPLAGAFSLDNQFFFVSTAGDDLIHFVKTSTLQDTQQLNPQLPACTPGSDPGCLNTNPNLTIVPTTVIAVKPRSTT
jgi:hypothetical protein